MLKILGIIGGLLLLAAFAVTVNSSKASATGESTVYASFSGRSASGLVQVVNFGSPNGSSVVARIQRPTTGVVWFCLTEANGSKSCGTVNPTNSGFDKSSKGCAKFTITFGDDFHPTRVEIFDTGVTSLASADLTTTAPHNLGYLNVC